MRSGPVQPEPRYKEEVRILVVEDEAALAAQLRSALEGAGYAVDRAASATAPTTWRAPKTTTPCCSTSDFPASTA